MSLARNTKIIQDRRKRNLKRPLQVFVRALNCLGLSLSLLGCNAGDVKIAMRDRALAAKIDASVDREPRANGPVVSVTGGKIEGEKVGRVSIFRGIPYAEPPTHSRRWQPPVPKNPWTGVRLTTNFPPPCPQIGYRAGSADSFFGDEDCLYLNVWAPKLDDRTERLPVMVFIHGGGNSTGSTTETWGDNLGHPFLLYDGEALAKNGRVILVTLQYRLGMLGHLGLPGLRDEQTTGTTGNYGKLDQVLALEWVKANAAAFGGDPSRITIFGESAGAFNVCGLIGSPLAKGLFSGAIAQSGACEVKTIGTSFEEGAEFAKQAGCEKSTNGETVQCLRSLSAATLVAKQPPMRKSFFGQGSYRATVDGYFLAGEPLDIFRAGNHNRVPVLLGSNSDEMKFFFLPAKTSAVAELLKLAPHIGIENFLKLISYYPASEYGGSREKAATVVSSDIMFSCPMQEEALKLQSSSNAPVYGYYYPHSVGGTAKLNADVIVRATISTTLTISGPLGEFTRRIPLIKSVQGTHAFFLSKKLIELIAMHGMELPFVFQRWNQWKKSLNQFADDELRKDLPMLSAEADAKARARMQANIPPAVQQGINEAIAEFKRAHPLLGGILRFSNTPVKVTGVTASVDANVNLQFDGDEERVQRAFLRYWTNFAHFGNPSIDWNPKFSDKAPVWPPLTPSTLSYFEINVTPRLLGDFKRDTCAFINQEVRQSPSP